MHPFLLSIKLSHLSSSHACLRRLVRGAGRKFSVGIIFIGNPVGAHSILKPSPAPRAQLSAIFPLPSSRQIRTIPLWFHALCAHNQNASRNYLPVFLFFLPLTYYALRLFYSKPIACSRSLGAIACTWSVPFEAVSAVAHDASLFPSYSFALRLLCLNLCVWR